MLFWKRNMYYHAFRRGEKLEHATKRSYFRRKQYAMDIVEYAKFIPLFDPGTEKIMKK